MTLESSGVEWRGCTAAVIGFSDATYPMAIKVNNSILWQDILIEVLFLCVLQWNCWNQLMVGP